MIRSLKESKAKLSELVERANSGEDVLITVRGEIKARLTRAAVPSEEFNVKEWAAELLDLHGKYGTGKVGLPVETLLEQDRDERL
jgi:prevent-host-death family protein